MTRRSFLASLGFLAVSPFFTLRASARTQDRHFEGEMIVAANTTGLALELTSASRQSRLATGQIWLDGDVHGVNGRFSRDRKKLSLSAGLPNNQEVRLEGKFSQRGTLFAGRVVLYANGAPVSGGTFSLRES
jgi:hypothetical protein